MPTKTYELRHHANKREEATIVESVKRQQEVLLDTTVRLTEFFLKTALFLGSYQKAATGGK